MSDTPRVGIFLPSLNVGGAQRVLLTLAEDFVQRGIGVDLVVPRVVGWSGLQQIPPGVRVVDLGRKRVLTSLPGLVRYLRAQRPAVLLTTMGHGNVAGLWARRLARVNTRVIIREANTISVATKGGRARDRLVARLVRRYYPWADEVVAVSQGVAADLVETTHLPRTRIHVLPSPVVTSDLAVRAAEPLDDAWFAPGAPPVILGVGRLEKQKDFASLIRAFALIRSQRDARLLILGEGTERPGLESLLEQLGVAEDARLPGFVSNPFAYMARASVFVLSSAWEGMPGVLIQALACGAPVVATDCESGPREVLAGGKFGRLVPVGDAGALAGAITATLDAPPRALPQEVLEPYTQEAAVKGYFHLLRIPARV